MEKLKKLNKREQEELVPEMARLLLRNENSKSDGFTGGKEWDELDPTDKNELLCRACEILDQDWVNIVATTRSQTPGDGAI